MHGLGEAFLFPVMAGGKGVRVCKHTMGPGITIRFWPHVQTKEFAIDSEIEHNGALSSPAAHAELENRDSQWKESGSQYCTLSFQLLWSILVRMSR